MDRVRFGRVLGVGARQTAKTLVSAVQAATAPDPAPRPRHVAAPLPETVPQTVRGGPSATQVATQARKAGQSFWGPVAKFSSVLWMEVTGAFFAIFAIFVGTAAWRLRGVLLLRQTPRPPEDVHRFYIYLAVFVLFAYFALSSFLRARRRQRR